MTTVKVTTVGNSKGIILNKEVLAVLGAEKGDNLTLVRSPLGYHIAHFGEREKRQLDIGREVMKKNRDALRKLAE